MREKIKYQLCCLIILLLGVVYQVDGQNLIPNNSFEEFRALPDRDGDFSKLKYWKNPSGDHRDNFQYGTPDFFHLDGTGKAQMPETGMGVIYPEYGKAVVGIITFNKQDEEIQDFREYLSISLNEPLVPGKEYDLSFYVCNGIRKQYGKYGTNNIGVLFSEYAVTQENNQPIPITPQLETSEIIYSLSWKKIKFVYTPDRAYRYMTIGNFRTDASTNILEMGHASHSAEYAYYFLDNFYLQLTSPEIEPIVVTKPIIEEEPIVVAEPIAEEIPDVEPIAETPPVFSTPAPRIPVEGPPRETITIVEDEPEPALSEEDKYTLIVEESTRKKETLLYKLAKDGKVVVDIHFAADSFNLVDNHYPDLDSIYMFLRTYPHKVVEVGGHTNGLCDDEFCFELSKNRAGSVAKYLMEKGKLRHSQIRVRGYGKTQNIADNGTRAGRRKNQRVEIRVIDP